jgi:hypothetical protein
MTKRYGKKYSVRKRGPRRQDHRKVCPKSRPEGIQASVCADRRRESDSFGHDGQLLSVRVVVHLRLVDSPQDKRAVVVRLCLVSTRESSRGMHGGTYVGGDWLRSEPPSAQDDAATGQDHAFISPEVVIHGIVEILVEVLHEGDTLPARYTLLRG